MADACGYFPVDGEVRLGGDGENGVQSSFGRRLCEDAAVLVCVFPVYLFPVYAFPVYMFLR